MDRLSSWGFGRPDLADFDEGPVRRKHNRVQHPLNPKTAREREMHSAERVRRYRSNKFKRNCAPARVIDIEDNGDVRTLAQELLDKQMIYFDLALWAYLRGVPLPVLGLSSKKNRGIQGIIRSYRLPDIEYQRLAA